MAVAQLEERTALGFLLRHLESAIKGSARDENAHCLVEHDQRFANGIDDSFFQGTALLGSGHRVFLDHRRPINLSRPRNMSNEVPRPRS